MTPKQILSLPGAERLREWAEIGPVQRAAVETVMEAVWNAALDEAITVCESWATYWTALGEPSHFQMSEAYVKAIKNLKESQP